nr:YbaK/EbsC family protein [uncultured Solibaculum sp.]
MSVESVKEYLKQWGKDTAVMEFSVSSATVDLAAGALGVIPARIAKTLSFEDPEGCILIVAAGDVRINNAKFKAQFGRKARMLSPDQVLELTGHPVGGVCPFDVDIRKVKVYTDVSLKRFDTVFPACGSGNSAVELTPDELFQCAGSLAWIDVCKDWQEI